MSNQNPKNHPKKPTLVVAIGASAGGLESFTAFLSAMPDDSDMAFVLLPHLNPEQRSLMAELLACHTSMKVVEASDNALVKPNQVYVLPAGKQLTIGKGLLHLMPIDNDRSRWTVIEIFMHSLAIEQKQRSVAIIMSGTGNHGTQGIREVKLGGGMILAQQPSTCSNQQMPTSAIETGLVDLVLKPEDMPQALLEYATHPYVEASDKQAPEGAFDEMQQILTVVRRRVKHDFSCYRKNMLLRRIQRRMSVSHCETLTDYYHFLKENSEETLALCKDLLIGVTAFFRDPESFHVLEQRIIPELVAKSSEDNPVRIWVPACATGEEAYSLGILFHEEFEKHNKPLALQIFASDIDEESLRVARQGIYPESIKVDVSTERLHRFFNKTPDDRYCVNKSLRGSIVFASQNLICDAPFSRLDLVSCRNFLIYLQTELQAKVISLFHFSLKEGGYLSLGPSESIGKKQELFSTVSKKWRLFKYVEQTNQYPLDLPTRTNTVPRHEIESNVAFLNTPKNTNTLYSELVQKDLLNAYAPAAVLIDRNYEILHFQGPTVEYLEFPKGLPSNNLTVLVREGLRTKIRAAVHLAIKTGQIVVDANARIKRQKHYSPCLLTVRPVQEPKLARQLFLVTFERGEKKTVEQLSNLNQLGDKNKPLTEKTIISQLEDELDATREDLQSNIEELKASNEEVMSMNEELQSANEELETSKEELQSSNEELTTVNTELQCKLEEIEKSSDDITNLLSSTDIATIFLNRQMKIMLFNPATANLLSLRKSDIDRPISDFSSKVANDHLLQDAQSVLDHLSPVERDVQSVETEGEGENRSRFYSRRIVPYRTSDDRIAGVVVTFVEITDRYQQEKLLEERIKERTEKLYERENRLLSIMEHASEAIIVIDGHGSITDFNRAAETMFGYSASEIIGNNVNQLMPSPYKEKHNEYIAKHNSNDKQEILLRRRNLTGLHKKGHIFPIELTVNQVDHLKLFVGIIRDLSETRSLQKAIAELNTQTQEKIGIELHDNLGQKLTGINLLLKNLKRNYELKQKLDAGSFEEINNQVKQAIGETRNLSHGLAPISLTPAGLQDAISTLAKKTNSTQVHCHFSCETKREVNDRNIAMQLYRIVQEAINNALKHANAKDIKVTLAEQGEDCYLSVQDDGEGFNLESEKHKNGIGIQIMYYRADSIGARLTITSTPDEGTCVTCYFS